MYTSNRFTIRQIRPEFSEGVALLAHASFRRSWSLLHCALLLAILSGKGRKKRTEPACTNPAVLRKAQCNRNTSPRTVRYALAQTARYNMKAGIAEDTDDLGLENSLSMEWG